MLTRMSHLHTRTFYLNGVVSDEASLPGFPPAVLMRLAGWPSCVFFKCSYLKRCCLGFLCRCGVQVLNLSLSKLHYNVTTTRLVNPDQLLSEIMAILPKKNVDFVQKG